MHCDLHEATDTPLLFTCSRCGVSMKLRRPPVNGRLVMVCTAREGDPAAPAQPSRTRERWPKIADVPCLHRGELLRVVDCELCGMRDQQAEIHACSIHGECAVRRWWATGKKIKMGQCLQCDDRQEPNMPSYYTSYYSIQPGRPDIPTREPYPTTVSIIVTARNYGAFLQECLLSCWNQTIRPAEVIYSDDFSTDDSLAIARGVAGVKVLGYHRHTGVVESRNRGVQASAGELLIHVDGDDVLTRDFVEMHLRAIKPETPFVYGPAQAFGLHKSHWAVPAWDRLFIYRQNYVNTSAAIWRWAFEAAGRWQETATKTMWDWDLFLRAARLGTPEPSRALLLYRQHAASWSHTFEAEWDLAQRISKFGPMRRAAARLSVGVVFSGRVFGLLPKWCKALRRDLRSLDVPAHRQEIVFLNNSPQRDHAEQLEWYAAKYFDCPARVIHWPHRFDGRSERQRRDGVATLMASASNRLMQELAGEVIHFREDDVIPPAGGMARMWQHLSEGNNMPAAVAGLYRNRHCPQFVGGWFNPEGPVEIKEVPSSHEPLRVDFTGTGCLLFWRGMCPSTWRSHWNSVPAHDWAWGQDLKGFEGSRIDVLPGVVCRHYTTAREWI